MSGPRDEQAAPDDEAAYHWAGDEFGGREGDHLPVTKIPDAGSAPAVEPASPAPPARRGSAVVAGLFGLLYVAVTIGWIIGTQYTSAGTAQLLPQVLWQFGEFTAILAAPIWFGTTLRLTPGRVGVRAGFLLLGLGVLLPWPALPLLVVGS